MGLSRSPDNSRSRRPKHGGSDHADPSERATRSRHHDTTYAARSGRMRDATDDGRARRRSRSPSRRRNRSQERERPTRQRQDSSDRKRSYRDRHRGRDSGRDHDAEGSRNASQERRPGSRSSLRQGSDNTRQDDRNVDRSLAKRSGPLPSQADSFALTKGEAPEKAKEKANFGITGHLAAASNSITQADGTTVTLKYQEPPEARKPSPRDDWKLFVFKGPEIVDTIDLSQRSCWLVGREAAVADLLTEHPSISKQHAVIQFRHTEKRNEFGDKIGKVKPYLIDLDSANGTMLNNEKVPDRRYLELRDRDMIQFGLSTREYVLMLAPKA